MCEGAADMFRGTNTGIQRRPLENLIRVYRVGPLHISQYWQYEGRSESKERFAI